MKKVIWLTRNFYNPLNLENNLIILGSGRSGTSMVTGSLSKSGFHMGENADYLKKNKANPLGFFEDYEVNTINEDILNKVLIPIPTKIRKAFFPSYTFYRARWLARIPLTAKITSNINIDQRIKKVLTNEPFCYKDPRFSYTLPVWQKHLSTDTKYIVVFRHPYKTAESINRECEESPALRKLKMNKKIALQIWRLMYAHILKNFSTSPQKENWLFLHYDQFFQEGIEQKIFGFCSAKPDIDFADNRLSRTGETENIREKKIFDIYKKLNNLANYKSAIS